MRFLVLMAEEDHFDRWEAASEQEQQAFFDGLAAFTAAVRERGEVLFGEALDRPERAVTLRGRTRTTDGPYAETVEQVGGFYVVDLPSQELAVETARLLPVPSVEVRPILDMRSRRSSRSRSERSVGPGALDTALRDEWGRLLALLVARYRRLDLAEDGLADAFEAAARTWPADGVPDQSRCLAARGGPAPDHRPAAGRSGRQPQAPAAGRRCRPHRGGAAHHGRPG